MKYLLDTQAVIWYYEISPKLPKSIEDLIDDASIDVYICSASLWEIAIKTNLGKLSLKLPLDDLLYSIRNRDFHILHIEDEYLNGLMKLPYIHKDPFDRLIISTALAEDLTIITIDESIRKYDVPWVW